MCGLRLNSNGDRVFQSRFGPAVSAGLMALAVLLMLQPACLFKKKPKADAPQVPASPVRIAVLPLNVARENSDLRWVALAIPAMLAKAAQSAQDLELAPLWESMPVAIESTGDSRAVTAEVAAYVASRASAKWGVSGEISPSKGGIALQIDFIPVKATNYAFRFSRTTTVEAIPAECYESMVEFLRYQVARPPIKLDLRREAGSMKQLAEAIDLEYGWFVAAAPGKSSTTVGNLGQADNRLARTLFSPAVYMSLGGPTPEAPKASGSIPSRAQIPVAPETTVPVAAPSQPEKTSPPAEQTVPGAAEFQKFTPPPPQTFSQMLPALQAPVAKPVETSVESAKPADKKSEGRAKTGEKKGVRIQVFASQSRKEAEEMAAKLAGWGYAAGVEQVDLADKGIWYRLRLQPFPNRKEATEAGEKMLSENLIKGYWIVP